MPDQDILNFLPHYLIHSQLYYVVVVGMDGCYMYVNDCFRQRFSFITDEFIGKHSYIAIYHEDHAKCDAAVQECFANPTKPVRLILRKPDTTVDDFYWTQWEFSVLENNGEVIGILCIGHDMTYTQRFSHQEYLLKAIYNSSNEPNVFVDKNLIIRYNNKAAREMTKLFFGKEAEIGDYLLDFVLSHQQAEYLHLCKQALCGETVTAEWSNGNYWWLTTMFPVYNKEGQIVGMTVNSQDISERKLREQQIIRQNVSLRAIAWKQSHEVRRPLANILGLCTLLKIDDTATLEEKLLYIDYLLVEAEELDTIIREIISESNKS
jgi:PAS domain S-box-containing protein